MKLEHYISKKIQTHPSLFKDVDYEKSKIKVLNHIFLVNGNGLELAYTENPEDGGYYVEPRYFRDKSDEWVRKLDKPYGKEKHKGLGEDYFKNTVYYIYPEPNDVFIRKGNRFKTTDVLIEYSEHFRKPEITEAKSRYPYSPYPLSEYSKCCQIVDENLFVQQDWLDGLLLIAQRALSYYQDPEQYCSHTYYPTPNSINIDLRSFQETFKSKGANGVSKLRELWCYATSDNIPSEDEIRERKERGRDIYLEDQIKILTNIINKIK